MTTNPPWLDPNAPECQRVSWCTLRDGHPSETVRDVSEYPGFQPGDTIRIHGRQLSDEALGIEIAQVQNLDQGRSLPPVVYFFANGEHGLSADRLRALSDRLRLVASELEQLQQT